MTMMMIDDNDDDDDHDGDVAADRGGDCDIDG